MATINATNTPILTTNGQIIVGSTGAFPAATTITAGSNITVTNGAGSITIAATSGTSALTLIATATASSTSLLDFANNLTSTYDNYIIVINNLLPSTTQVSLKLRFGTGATPTYSSTSYSSTVAGQLTTSSTVSWQGNPVSTTTGIILSNDLTTASAHNAGLTNAANFTSGFIVYIFNANSSTYKLAMSKGESNNVASSDTGDVASICGGTWADTTVITSLRFFMTTSTISTGTFRLYGYKNS